MALCDELRRDVFLAQFGYKRATKYPWIHNGREYDSKAIAGVAYNIQHHTKVTARDFSGGETVLKALERLKLGVARPRSRNAEARHEVTRRATPWDADEMVLALHYYLLHRTETLGSDDPRVRVLSSILGKRAALRRGTGSGRSRGADEVARQMNGFGPLDPMNPHRGASEPSAMHAEIWGRYARQTYTRVRKVREILHALEIANKQATPSEVRRQLAAAWGVEESRTGYRLRPKNAKAVEPELEPTTTPELLRSPYKGRRKLEPRTAAVLPPEDPELYDRANEAHENLRVALADFLVLGGLTPWDPSKDARRRKVDFDLLADGAELRLVIEAKSMPATRMAEGGRLRLGLGQVLWYRHRFFSVCGERRVAVLAVEREPHEREDWLAACRAVGVVLTWPERFEWLLDECRYARVRE
jgi:hypothetical protein